MVKVFLLTATALLAVGVSCSSNGASTDSSSPPNAAPASSPSASSSAEGQEYECQDAPDSVQSILQSGAEEDASFSEIKYVDASGSEQPGMYVAAEIETPDSVSPVIGTWYFPSLTEANGVEALNPFAKRFTNFSDESSNESRDHLAKLTHQAGRTAAECVARSSSTMLSPNP